MTRDIPPHAKPGEGALGAAEVGMGVLGVERKGVASGPFGEPRQARTPPRPGYARPPSPLSREGYPRFVLSTAGLWAPGQARGDHGAWDVPRPQRGARLARIR
ncbi:hypothetical protein GCM10008170_09080 [Methylopila capsulata]|uniref:Uncharacterized protein n=1 Tax=Methylopila capsulata TaxID=61654 RepID=A0A9W6ISR0_9HYPH|nr:hypothetical protein GCM10008170_09080 [Methylopila capsulata]